MQCFRQYLSNNPIARAAAFCVLAIACVAFLNFLLVPWSSLESKFDGYKVADGKIETLILGSSLEGHISRALLCKEFHTNVFAFNPQSGYPETSYYILKNALRTNKIKRVIAGWDILQMMQVPHHFYPHTEEFYREFIPYMKCDSEIFWYTAKGIMTQPYTYSFFKYASFPENLTMLGEVFESKRKKRATSDTNMLTLADGTIPYKLVDFTEPPATEDHGIEATNIEDPRYNYHKVVDLTYTTAVYDSDKSYVRKITKLCKENGVDLWFIYCPVPQVVIDALPNYPAMVQSARDMFREVGAKYIDTLDPQYFPNITEDKNFSDCPGHFTAAYEDTYNAAICRWITDHSASN